MIAVIGGHGFIGSNLAPLLGARVIEKGDPLLLDDIDTVIHLGANADVRGGWNDPTRDIEGNLVLTSRVLEAMRSYDVRRLVFASSAAVYEPSFKPHPEYDPVHATSLYSASKIASEQLIAAYAAAGHISATVFRFVSVLGPHLHRGLVYDFVQKLRADPARLEVIGPGTGRKGYVHVADVCRAVEKVLPRDPGFEILNVGTDETDTPIGVAKTVADGMWIMPKIEVVGDTWVGDNPDISVDCRELRYLGWTPEHSIHDAIFDTVRWLTR